MAPPLRLPFGMTERLERITIEDGTCGGRPCIRGMRVRVQDILEMLAVGAGSDQILADFPYLEPYLEADGVGALLAYAFDLVNTRFSRSG